MYNKILLSVLVIFSYSALASWDFEVGTAGRSFPLGGSVEASSGYGVILWGQETRSSSGPKSPWYGYLRPALQLASAGTWNSGALEFSVFPISILGVTAHTEAIHNSSDYADFSCESHQCTGWFYRHYLEAQLALGAGPVFFLAQGRLESHSQEKEDSGSFIDPLSGLILQAEGEKIAIATGIVGLNLSEHFRLAAVNTHAINDSETLFTRMSLLTVQYRIGAWSAVLGGGSYDGSTQDPHITGIISLNYTIKPSVEL